jgi:thymidylate synthase ThyX
MLAVEVEQHMTDLKKTKLGTPAEMLNFVFLVRDVPRSWTHQAVRTRIGAAVVQESTRFIGAKDVYNVLVPRTAHNGSTVDPAYLTGNIQALAAYEEMLTHAGVASQDARNLLPHSLLTHMYWSLTLRALMGIYDVRWCCQAEPSTWIPVMKQMKSLITMSCGSNIADFLSAPILRGQSCGFNASFDRPCEWKVR